MLDNSGQMSLPAISEDVQPSSNNGLLVLNMIASAGGDRITDVDASALEGIDVTAANDTDGTWQFSTNNGASWTPFATPIAQNARLLAANALTRVRFVPKLHDALVDDLVNNRKTGAEVLRAVSKSPEVSQKFFNKAFVVVAYFGYLRRNPDAKYLEWISMLDNPPAGKTYQQVYRDLISGFINSAEYRARFGPN